MQDPGQAAAVTPDGVRSGDPAALAALCERRGSAVLAYAREVCEPADATLAAAEALARFRAAVWASGDAADLDPERLLLSATRHASAAHARPPQEASATRRILGRAHTDAYARMPGLIVARTENLLGSADLDRLSRHLERCQSCRAVEAAFRRAERAYVATTHPALDSATTALLLAALTEAAPVEAEATSGSDPDVASPEPVPAPVPVLEPEPAAETLPDVFDDPDEDGWTGEPEPEPGAPVDDAYDHHMIEPGPATWNATEEPPRRRRRLRVAVPVVAVAAGAAAALAIAGVFDGSGGSSSATTQTVRTTPAAPTTGTTAKRKRHKAATTHPTIVTANP